MGSGEPMTIDFTTRNEMEKTPKNDKNQQLRKIKTKDKKTVKNSDKSALEQILSKQNQNIESDEKKIIQVLQAYLRWI